MPRQQAAAVRGPEEELGFGGVVISDYGGVKKLSTVHMVARDCLKAAVKALRAGVDIELPDAECFPYLVEAVRRGLIDEEAVDRAVERVLKLKLLLGLFDNPFVDESRVPEQLDSESDRRLAEEAAKKSVVLLKNDGVLPIRGDVRTIAVVGPNAHDPWAMLGDYHYDVHVGPHDVSYGGASPSVRVVTVLEALRSRVPEGVEVLYAKGCETYGDGRGGFQEALRAAKSADLVVAVMGDRSGLFNQRLFTSGEGVDRASLRPPGAQEELLKELASVGKPVVLVLTNGRPLSLAPVLPYVNAVVEAWRPGEECGSAVADVLLGFYNPGGRLSVSLPHDVGQLPVYYSRRPAGLKDYVEYPYRALFPFGYGLSYTKLEYSVLVVSRQRSETWKPQSG